MRLFAVRLLRLVAVLLAVTFASFVMVSLLPGDIVTALLGDRSTPEEQQAVRDELRLEDPVPVRYVRWVGDAVQGDLGVSYRTGQPVAESLQQRIGVTLELVVLSQIIALAIAVPMAIAGSLRPGGWLDRVLSGVQLALLALPGYLLALGLIALFAVRLGWFDTGGYVSLRDDPLGNLRAMALPAFALGLEQVAMYARVLRSDLISTFDQQFIWLARAKGNPTSRIVARHALRPASLGTLTLAGITLGRLIGGAVLIETIFALPGLGRFTIDAINNRDYMALQGAVVVATVGFVVVNVAVDLLHTVLDPRIRAAGRPT